MASSGLSIFFTISPSNTIVDFYLFTLTRQAMIEALWRL